MDGGWMEGVIDEYRARKRLRVCRVKNILSRIISSVLIKIINVSVFWNFFWILWDVIFEYYWIVVYYFCYLKI